MKKATIIKYIILVLMSTHISLDMYSQTINWGSENESPFSSTVYLPILLGEDDDNFYTYTNHNYSYNLVFEAFNKKTKKQLYFKKYNLLKKERTNWVTKVVLVNHKIMLFITEFNNSDNKINLYAAVFNPKTGEIEEDRLDLLSYTSKKKNSIINGKFNTYTSPDHSKILINYVAYDVEKNKSSSNYVLLNEKLEQIVSRENTYDGKKGDDGSHYTIDNDGNLYFLKKNGLKNSLVSYDVKNDYEKWEAEIALTNLDLKLNSVITELKLNINRNNELTIYGIYCKNAPNYEEPKGAFDGYIHFKVDPNSKEIIQEGLILLEDSIVSEIKSNMGKNKLYFDLNIFNLDNGETILTSEFYITYRVSKSGKKVVRYFDILASKISKSRELSWSLRIPKRQKYTARNLQIPTYFKPFYSSTTFLDLTTAYILFNDHPKNMFETQNSLDIKMMGNPKKSKVSVYAIDLQTGEFKTSSLKKDEESKLALMAPLSFQKEQGSNSYVFKKHGNKYAYGIFSK